MKRILLLNFDARTVGNLQAEYARKCEFFATDDFDIAFQLVKKEMIETVFIKAPPDKNSTMLLELKSFLKKANKKKFKSLRKILIAEKGGDVNIEGFMKYGISAVILDVGEVGRWINN